MRAVPAACPITLIEPLSRADHWMQFTSPVTVIDPAVIATGVPSSSVTSNGAFSVDDSSAMFLLLYGAFCALAK